MEYKLKKNNVASADLRITFNPKDIEKGFQKAYENARGKIKVNGFRPGKAPLDIVEQMLGDAVADDAINILLKETFQEIYSALEHQPISVPKFEVEQFDRKKTLIVKATFDTRPEVTLPKYKKMKVEVQPVKIGEDDIEKELKSIQKKMMRTQLREPEEKVAIDDVLDIQYSFEPNIGNAKFPADVMINLGETENTPEGFAAHLAGMGFGETKTFDYKYPDNFQNEQFAGQTFKYTVVVKSIYKPVYPEINDDLAIDWDGTETLEKFKAKIKERLSDYITGALESRYTTELMDKIVKESKFIIPDSLIQEEIEAVYHNMIHEFHLPHISMEEYAKQAGKELPEVKKTFETIASNRIKSWVTGYKIAEVEKLEVTDHDYEEALQKMALSSGREYKDIVKETKKNKVESNLKQKILFEKVHKFIFDISEKKKGKEITLQDAIKMLNAVPNTEEKK
ncbi:MAG: trigger factor [Leptospira sp.]|nr:trigger factor [Leptospira sp.]